MKVLVSAFSCCPGRGSEPGVGWNWVREISKEHEVWLLTSDEFESQIKQAVNERIHPTFIPSFALWNRLQKQAIPGLDWIYYYWWQWKAYRAARLLHAQVHFELVHHVTFVSWRAPSFVSLLPVPFIWGPVGGGGIPPRGLSGELGGKGRLSEGFRAWCQLLPRLDPGVRLTMSRAALILANVQETADLIPKRFHHKVGLMFGIGMEAKGRELVTSPVQNARFLILFAAQLRPIKGGSLAIKAFAQLVAAEPQSELVILGEGSEQTRMVRLARELGVEDRVRFLGWLPREQVADWMKRCDVLLHPSLRDSGGMVLLEAMVENKPVICLDLGGPGHIVTPESGFKIPPRDPDQAAHEIASALKRLSSDPTLRREMGQAGYRRVSEVFNWERRREQMMGYYRQVTSGARKDLHDQAIG